MLVMVVALAIVVTVVVVANIADDTVVILNVNRPLSVAGGRTMTGGPRDTQDH